MPIRFVALDTDLVRGWQAGLPDANGQTPERAVSDGQGIPCRHTLAMVPKGEPFLILAHRPFPAPQPYAEVGPIFVHAEPRPQGGGSDRIPSFLDSPRYIIRGYGADDRIIYGTGQIVQTPEIPAAAAAMFENGKVRYIHVRSASNNCYHCRIDRA
jgi:Protein of unknown function (DUF1203)